MVAHEDVTLDMLLEVKQQVEQAASAEDARDIVHSNNVGGWMYFLYCCEDCDGPLTKEGVLYQVDMSIEDFKKAKAQPPEGL